MSLFFQIKLSDFFLSLVNMSITASYLVLAIILFRLIFKKAPKWINCLLWGLVGFRLICPISIESFLSLIPTTQTVTRDPAIVTHVQVNSGILPVDKAFEDILPLTEIGGTSPEMISAFKATNLIAIIWFIGVSAMFIYTAVSYGKIKTKLKEAIRTKDNIYICDKISSPFILGIIKPKIYLPSYLSDEDAACVIAHEKAHIKRRDYIWKPLGFFIFSIYWFNPVMWLSYILLCKDIELACDESVIKDKGEEIKKTYSHALINCSAEKRFITACPVAFGENSVKARVKSVLRYKKPAFWLIIIALIASVIISACLVTNPLSKKEISDEIRVFVNSAIEDYHYNVAENEYLSYDYSVLDTKETADKITVYISYRYTVFHCEDKKLYNGEAGIIPGAVEITKKDDTYASSSLWCPRDGSFNLSDLEEKFTYTALKNWENGNYDYDAMCDNVIKKAQKHFGLSENAIPLLNYDGYYESIYTYESEHDKATIILSELLQEYSFTPSFLSSTISEGEYDENPNYIYLKSAGGKTQYTFKHQGYDLIFDEYHSDKMPQYKYSSNGKPQPCIPDGAVFKLVGKRLASVDETEYDIDNDGEKEFCRITVNPTSGVFCFGVEIYEADDNINPAYRSFFTSEYYILNFDEEGGKLKIKSSVPENNPAEVSFNVEINKNTILLTGDTEYVSEVDIEI